MPSTSTQSEKNFAIDWKAKIGGHKVTRTLIYRAHVQPTRHLSYNLAKADAQNYAKTALLQSIVVLGVRGVGRKGLYSTKDRIGYSN